MRTPSPSAVSTGLHRIAELARQAPTMAFTTLAHHIDVELLKEAYRLTRKNGATGIDGVTAAEYEGALDENLRSLLDRFKAGTYRAPPVRRVHIPKGDGRQTRPIGIPTFEDKVLQRAVSMVLNAVYEQDFLDCSYGFRPGRSAHDAVQALWNGLMAMGGGWVLDVDLSDFFGTLTHSHLRDFLDQRVRDGVILRVLGKWLKAGVMEQGSVSYPDAGTPQGGVISPLLSNIYLHEVLDRWFEEVVKPRLAGEAQLVRYADDFVIVCALEDDARRVMKVLPLRLGRFGLSIHPEKSRLVDFRRPSARPGRDDRNKPPPGTFDLLGFTHYWGRSRQKRWVVKRRTSRKRFNGAVKRIAAWCRRYMHRPIPEQQAGLERKLRGHNGYYGITGNYEALARFRYATVRIWRRWLDRRSNSKPMTWERFNLLLKRYPLPQPRVIRLHARYRVANS